MDIYEKVAAARWQREEPNLSPDELRSRRNTYWQQGADSADKYLSQAKSERRDALEKWVKSQGELYHAEKALREGGLWQKYREQVR